MLYIIVSEFFVIIIFVKVFLECGRLKGFSVQDANFVGIFLLCCDYAP